MPLYEYRAVAPDGQVAHGRMEAPDRDGVVRRLQSQQHLPIRVEPAVDVAAKAGPRRGRRRLGAADITLFTIEFSTLLEAGLTVDRALEVLAEISVPGPLRDMFATMQTEVRGGADLSRALERYPAHFSRFYRNMVRAGEASGSLDAALGRLADFMERGRALRSSVISALVYPCIVVFVAVVSLTVVLGYVVPKLAIMFEDAGRVLPLSTRVVVAAGDSVQGYWWLAAALAVAGWLGARAAMQRPRIRRRVHRLVLSAPLIGTLVTRYEVARFTRTLGTLLESGVPLLEALAIAGEVIGNQVMADSVETLAESVRQGRGIAGPLVASGVFPPMAAHLVEVGEQTGALEPMLLKLASIYDNEVDMAVNRIVGLLAPAMVLVLGVLIGGVILSVLSAVVSVNDLPS